MSDADSKRETENKIVTEKDIKMKVVKGIEGETESEIHQEGRKRERYEREEKRKRERERWRKKRLRNK